MPSSQQKFFKKSGFTLIEVLVVLIIFVFASLIITGLFLGHNSLYHFFSSEIGVGRSSRLAMDRMVGLIREADRVLPSYSFSGTAYDTDSDTLVLRLKTINFSNDIIPGSYDYAAFYLDPVEPRRLMEIIEADAASRLASNNRVLAGNVQSINFSYNPADLNLTKEVGIDLIAKEQFKNSSSTTVLAAQAKLRDKN